MNVLFYEHTVLWFIYTYNVYVVDVKLSCVDSGGIKCCHFGVLLCWDV